MNTVWAGLALEFTLMPKSSTPKTNTDQISEYDEALVVTVDRAAALLSLGRVSIYKLLRTGKLEARHFGRATRITRKSIEKLVNP